ncbi:hypothetical protein [Parasitella parasitica]|uniref:WW domain-containing protein n=1 Tax=Parasitella parasitica TaxID=35722 RepID=A0A0B7NE29_9FUNG|nr:hypothetical protein [Parasitella parasitica]
MSYNSGPTSEEQLPEVFRRLGKTVPPRDRRNYSGGQQPFDTGLRIVRPVHTEHQRPAFYQPQPQPNFQHANYNDMLIQASNSPPIYYRPQMNNDNNAVGFHPGFNPNNNPNAIISSNNSNSNSNIPVSYSSSSPLDSSAQTIPQNAFSFIPKDANQNSNPIISFVRNPNAGAMHSYGVPYQFLNGTMNPVDMKNGQQVLHPSPSIAPLVPSAPITSSMPPSAAKSATAGTPPALQKPPHNKKKGPDSSESTTQSNSSSRKYELDRQAPADIHDSNAHHKEDTPISQRDILAKSIKIIASRPLGADKNGGNTGRKHARQSDSESSEPEDGVPSPAIVNRKVIVATDDGKRNTSRERLPVTKKPKRTVSPTIHKRKRNSQSGSSDDGGARHPRQRRMSDDRLSRSRSRSRSYSRSRSRSCSRTRSRSVSSSRRRGANRQRSRSTHRRRDYSPGSSSDEEKAPFLRNQADRYRPDYNRRPLPPQFRQRSVSSPTARKLVFESTSLPTVSHATNTTPVPTVKHDPDSHAFTIDSRLHQNDASSNKPKDLGSYPPLGTSLSFDNSRIRADNATASSSMAAVSSVSKESFTNKPTIISHKIITKPSPTISSPRGKAAASNSENNSSLISNTSRSKTLSPTNQPTNIVKNASKMAPIKQEITEESIIDTSRQNKERHDVISGRVAQGSTSNDTNFSGSSVDSSNRSSNANTSAAIPLEKADERVIAMPSSSVGETTAQKQPRKHRVFTDSPVVDSVEISKNTPEASSMAPPVSNNVSTVPSVLQAPKTTTITQATRAAIKKRVAKEQERLDQERLRQLDIDDREDIVMDIAFPIQPRSSVPAKPAENAVAVDAATESLRKEATSNPDGLATIAVKGTKVLENTTSTTNPANPLSLIDRNITSTSVNGSISSNSTINISSNPTSATSSTTGHENVPSSDTATAGTNSAFTNMESSNDMWVPKGDTMLQSKSMSPPNSQMLTPPASLLQEPSVLVEKPLVQIYNNAVPSVSAAPTPPPPSKNKNKRLPKPWKAKMNDSGDIYYHNPVTGEESFVRPE